MGEARCSRTGTGKRKYRASARSLSERCKGEVDKGSVRKRTGDVPDYVHRRSIHEKTGLTQAQLADRFGFSHRTLQDWEQGRYKPENAGRAYLTVIQRNPEAVEEALRRASQLS